MISALSDLEFERAPIVASILTGKSALFKAGFSTVFIQVLWFPDSFVRGRLSCC